jgi:hypothetical protein
MSMLKSTYLSLARHLAADVVDVDWDQLWVHWYLLALTVHLLVAASLLNRDSNKID